jgi:colanic acid biosynthesis protein WcaH
VKLARSRPGRHRFDGDETSESMDEPTAPFEGMAVHDDWVPDDTYEEFVAHMPQVCVEVVLETDEGVLLAKRVNPPRVWFWPGGRLYKGESLPAAARRVAGEELGIIVDPVENFGPYAHFWRGSESAPSRHTVNVPFHSVPRQDPPEIVLDDQHSDYRFVDAVESWMHPYVTRYLEDSGIL